MTANAMGGTVKFEDALAMRLGLMKVSRTDMQNFLRDHPPRLSPGIRELVSTLQAKGKQVWAEGVNSFF
jgi:phosphoserine phosphatase